VRSAVSLSLANKKNNDPVDFESSKHVIVIRVARAMLPVIVSL